MRWLKHMTSTRQDEKIARLISKHGMAAYGLYWSVIEIVASALDSKTHPEPSISYPISRWAALLQVHPPNVRRQLAALGAEGLLELTCTATEIKLTIPNLLKYRDEYSQRSGHTPGSVPSKNQIQNQIQKAEVEQIDSDDSSASNKNRSKAPEFVNGLSSLPPIKRQNPNGLTPIGAIAKPQAPDLSVVDINALKAEMAAIHGEAPTQAAVLAVLNALGSASVIGFAKHLQGVDPRYRPNGHKAVRTWKWFESAAHSFSMSETPGPISATTCRHGTADGECPMCLPRAEFEERLEAM